MFDIGFSEIALILVVGLVVIKPQDLPVVIRHVMRVVREIRGVYMGLKTQMTQVIEEAGIDEIRHGMNTIVDLEGKSRVAYDVKELAQLRDSSSPYKGEVGRAPGQDAGLSPIPAPPQPFGGGMAESALTEVAKPAGEVP